MSDLALPSLTGTTIENGRLLLLDTLGHGAFGSVYLARDFGGESQEPAYVAVKAVPFSDLASRRLVLLQAELHLHRRVSAHPNVVTLHRAVKTDSMLFLVLDLIPGPDLFDQIVTHRRYSDDDSLVSSVFAQIVDAVATCHRFGFAHRDIKPENILSDEDGRTVYLADFGLSTTQRDSREFGTGSSYYMSPECRNDLYRPCESYNTAANDVWACGILLITLICGVNPWCEASVADESFRAYLSRLAEFLRVTLPLSEQAVELLLDILQVDPAQRITIRQLARKIRHVDKWSRATTTAEQASDTSQVDLAPATKPTGPPLAPPGFTGLPTPPTSPSNELPPVLKPTVPKVIKPALPISPPSSPRTTNAAALTLAFDAEAFFFPAVPTTAQQQTLGPPSGSESESTSALGLVLGDYLSGKGRQGFSDESEDEEDEDEEEEEEEEEGSGMESGGVEEGSYFPTFAVGLGTGATLLPAEVEFPAELEEELLALRMEDQRVGLAF